MESHGWDDAPVGPLHSHADPGPAVHVEEVVAPPDNPSSERLRNSLLGLSESPDGCAASSRKGLAGELAGTLLLSISLDGAGTVQGVSTEESATGSDGLAKCIEGLLRGRAVGSRRWERRAVQGPPARPTRPRSRGASGGRR